jgi:hypothetical protein
MDLIYRVGKSANQEERLDVFFSLTRAKVNGATWAVMPISSLTSPFVVTNSPLEFGGSHKVGSTKSSAFLFELHQLRYLHAMVRESSHKGIPGRTFYTVCTASRYSFAIRKLIMFGAGYGPSTVVAITMLSCGDSPVSWVFMVMSSKLGSGLPRKSIDSFFESLTLIWPSSASLGPVPLKSRYAPLRHW